MRKVLFFASLLVMASCGGEKEVPGDKIVKLQNASGIPIVKIKVNGKEVYAIMDTGASISVVNKNSNDNLDFNYFADPNSEEVAGYGGTTAMMLTDISGFELDGEYLRGEFKTQDLTNVISAMRNGTGYTITAIVGMNFMRKYDFAFDFEENVLTFNNN